MNGAVPVRVAIRRVVQPTWFVTPRAATAERAASGVSMAYEEGEHDGWAVC